MGQTGYSTVIAALKAHGLRIPGQGPTASTADCPICGQGGALHIGTAEPHVILTCEEGKCEPVAILAKVGLPPELADKPASPAKRAVLPRAHILEPKPAAPEPATASGAVLRRSELRTLPKPDPLIEDVISRLGVAVMVGGYGTGKTFTALSMALSVATGHNWLGRDVHQVPALYVVGEGAYGLDNRVSAWEQAWSTKVEDHEILFWTKPPSLAPVRQFGASPYSPAWGQIREQAGTIGAKFIILDTFSSLAAEADETKDAPWIIRECSDLAAAIGGAVMLVHHPGHSDPDRARGAYAIEANADEVLILSGSKDSPMIDLTRKKVKEGVSGGKIHLKKLPLHGSVVIQEAGTEEVRMEGQARCLDIIRATFAGADATRVRMVEALQDAGITRPTAYRNVAEMVRDGILTENGKSGSTSKYRCSRVS